VQLFRNHNQAASFLLLLLILALLLYLLIESNQRSQAIDKTLQQLPTQKIIGH